MPTQSCKEMYEVVCRDRFDKIDERLEHIADSTNHFSRRPTWFVALAITSLAAMVVFLAQYIITH